MSYLSKIKIQVWDGTAWVDVAGTAAGVVKTQQTGVTVIDVPVNVTNGAGEEVPVSGTVTANAGTNLNTSALATQATLASIKDTDGIKKITDALPAGTNLLGKVGIDQTTDGTTNKVTAELIDEAGTPYGVQQIDNKPRVSSMPYLYDIAEGNVTGHVPWAKIGYNGDVDAGTEDMIAQGGTYTFPAAETDMDIVSSDAADDAGGTGIVTVTLYYLDDTFTEKSVDIDLNGVTPVTTSVSDIYRVQNMRAKVCGTAGKAVGNITLSESGGTTYKYGYIMAGQTRQRQCVWTVPAGKTLYITSVGFSVGGATKEKAARFTTLATYDDKAAAVRTFFFPYTELVLEDSSHHRNLEIPTKLPAGVDLKVQVTGLVADCVCACTLKGWVE